jgi:uncharacterized membrane protein YeaQ/YmgE (transglycosylase-associated protein family)
MFLLLLAWIATGAVAGFIGGKLVTTSDDPRLGAVAGGVASAVIGGLFHFFSKTPPNATDYWSIVVAAGAGVLAVVIWYAVRTAASRA